jgi:hypothetical protein
MGFKILTVYVPVNSAQTIESSIDHVKNYFVYVTQRLSVPQNVRLFAQHANTGREPRIQHQSATIAPSNARHSPKVNRYQADCRRG